MKGGERDRGDRLTNGEGVWPGLSLPPSLGVRRECYSVEAQALLGFTMLMNSFPPEGRKSRPSLCACVCEMTDEH